jgi:hypothetical protein
MSTETIEILNAEAPDREPQRFQRPDPLSVSVSLYQLLPNLRTVFLQYP